MTITLKEDESINNEENKAYKSKLDEIVAVPVTVAPAVSDEE